MKIDIRGAIVSNDDQWVYEMFEMESTSPKNVIEAIDKANGEDLEVIINSGGGSVYDASDIYTALKDYPGNTKAKIVGLAASAASFIAMGTDTTVISPTAEMMIHNSAMVAFGDYREMDKASEMLKNTNIAISNAYRLKTGMSEEELLALMNKETWLTAQSAKEKGFVDQIMFEDPNIKLTASASISNTIPQAVIEGLRNGKGKQQQADVVSPAVLTQALSSLKAEILNELKQNKEPEPKPTPANKQNLSKLFLI